MTKKLVLVLFFLLGLVNTNSSNAAVVVPGTPVTPEISTPENTRWYIMMSSHIKDTDRQSRFLQWDGSKLVTVQYSSGMAESDITDNYRWKLVSAEDGKANHVYLVNAANGLRISVPSSAVSKDKATGSNTQLLMDTEGVVWEYKLSSEIGLSGDCAAHQYCFDYIGYTNGSEPAYLNAMPNTVDSKYQPYGVTIYEMGVHQASGWFFYEAPRVEITSATVTIETPANGELTVKKEDGTIVNSGDELDIDTKLKVEVVADEGYHLNSLYAGSENIKETKEFVLKSDVTIRATFISDEITEIAENPFETMINLGKLSKSVIYPMPFPGTNTGSMYITSAITSGDAVMYPLGYVRSAAPSKHFIIVSKETSLLTAGKDFDLILNENSDPSNQTITFYTDWDCNGTFEKADGEVKTDAASKSITKTFSIPEDAQLGKTRIRVRIETSTPSDANSTANGKVYDFVFYVKGKAVQPVEDFQITVASNNEEWGTAMIQTEANASGRYDKGTEVTVKAIKNTVENMVVSFDGWFNGETRVSEDEEYTFTVTENLHLVAKFSTTTGICPKDVTTTMPTGTLRNGTVRLTNVTPGSKIYVVSLSGQMMANVKAESTNVEIKLGYEEQYVAVVIEETNGNKSVLKLLNK